MTIGSDREKQLQRQREWEQRSREKAAERARGKPRKPLATTRRLVGSGKSLRAVPIKKRGPKAAQRERSQFGPHAAWIRKLPCEMCGTPFRRSQAHHAKHRKHGGLAKDLVPLCVVCHGKVHASWGDSVAAGVERSRVITRLKKRAAELWQQSPKRHLYCATCFEYTGRKACPTCAQLNPEPLESQ